jgi:hypothetical protein
LACTLAAAAWGQEGRTVRIIPEAPEVGAAFTVEASLPDERAEAIVPSEPGVSGPALYTGADVRPGDGGNAAVIEYRFIVTGIGRIDIIDLTARSLNRWIHLGSWSLESVAGVQPLPARLGSWDAPRTVVAREIFRIATLGPDGAPIACPAFAVEGALFEPIPGVPGAFYAVALDAGTLRLPALEIGGAGDACSLAARSIESRPLPPSAAKARAVGGSWRLELAAPRPGATVGLDEIVAWDLRAVGRGWPGLAAPPSLSVVAPDGTLPQTGGGTAYSSGTGSALGVVSGARGVFSVSGPGTYLVRPEPYPWFDTSTGTLRMASAAAVRVIVTARREPAWQAPDGVADFARRSLAALAEGDARWEPLLAAADTGDNPDWSAIRLAALGSAGVGSGRGALASARFTGPGAKDTAAALAALGLLAAGRDAESRAESYCVFLRLEKAAFPLRGVSGMADAAATSFGNLLRVSYVLPPFGWTAALGACFAIVACCAIAAVMIAARSDEGARRRRSGIRVVAVVSAVLGASSLAISAASAVERSVPRFVSLGGQARSVPSELAIQGPAIEAGRTGRVLRYADRWLFVETDDGRAVWLVGDDAALY